MTDNDTCLQRAVCDPSPRGGSLLARFASRRRFKLEKLCRSSRKYRRGAAVVEFAIVAPLLFLMVFGMIEFGRLVMVQQVLTNAAREGARRAILSGSTESDVVATVNEYLVGAGVQGATVTVNPTGNESVAVTVSVPFDQVSWLPTPMYIGGDAPPLTAVSAMRREVIY